MLRHRDEDCKDTNLTFSSSVKGCCCQFMNSNLYSWQQPGLSGNFHGGPLQLHVTQTQYLKLLWWQKMTNLEFISPIIWPCYVVLISISLMTKDIEYLSVSQPFQFSVFEKFLLDLYLLLIWLLVFLDTFSFWYFCSLYILDFNFLSDV